MPEPPLSSTPTSAFSYASALEFLGDFVDVERGGVPASVLGLDRIGEILAALGRPDTRYPSVLVAGTNGKGSTAAMIERGLRAAGYRTGLYTQPHLHTIRERVRLDGAICSEDRFAQSMAAVRDAVQLSGGPESRTTAYEVMTALALETFAREAVDVAVLEVGLGGRLDATNVVEAAVSVLTPISLDHTQILGDTVAAIAGEKADIIKHGRPCVSAPQSAAAMNVIAATALARRAPLRVAEHDGARWRSAASWDLVTTSGAAIDSVRPALIGAHQRTNAAVAATVLEELASAGLTRIDPPAIREAVEQVSWPGRFEIVGGALPLVIDGAHNPAGAAALRASLDAAYGGKRCVFVVGIGSDKDVPGILRALHGSGPPPDLLVVTRAGHPRSASPGEIEASARNAGLQTVRSPTVHQAIDLARSIAEPEDVVVVTGSLYVVAEARQAIGLDAAADEPLFNPWAAR